MPQVELYSQAIRAERNRRHHCRYSDHLDRDGASLNRALPSTNPERPDRFRSGKHSSVLIPETERCSIHET